MIRAWYQVANAGASAKITKVRIHYPAVSVGIRVPFSGKRSHYHMSAMIHPVGVLHLDQPRGVNTTQPVQLVRKVR